MADFKAKFGNNPQPFAAQSYDCAAILLKAIENAAKANGNKMPARADVSKAVRALQNFHGVTANITFNAKGDPAKGKYFIIQVSSPDPAKWAANRIDQTLDIAPPQ
jgi:branched-chain amino acid transport system substrate-binding protein